MLIENGVLIQNGVSIDCMCDSNWNDTVFLCHFDGTNAQTGPYTDNSAAQTIIQTYGTASLTTSQKYFGTASLNLDGSGYVKPNYPSGKNPTYDLGIISSSTNFTVEFFYKPAVVNAADRILMAHALPGSGGSGIGGWSISTESNGKISFTTSKNSTAGSGWFASFQTTNTVLTSTSTWYHVALVISQGVPKIFVNGLEQSASFANLGPVYATSIIGFDTTKTNYGLIIGALDTDSTNPSINYYANGYMDDLRITTNVARYTSNFTVPDTPYPNVPCTYDQYFRNVSLLLPMNGISGSTNFIDYSPSTKIITVNGNTSISPAQSKWGGSSGYFDGTGDFLSLVYNSVFNLGTDSFTFEVWINPSSVSGIFGVYGTSGGPGSVPKFVVHLNNGTPSVHYNGFTNGNNIYTSASSAVVINAWTHIAYVRNVSTWTWYINGVAAGTGSNSADIIFTNQPTYVGYGGEAFFTEFNGYMDDLRMTKGVARYTSSFTPPTQSFPIVGC